VHRGVALVTPRWRNHVRNDGRPGQAQTLIARALIVLSPVKRRPGVMVALPAHLTPVNRSVRRPHGRSEVSTPGTLSYHVLLYASHGGEVIL